MSLYAFILSVVMIFVISVLITIIRHLRTVIIRTAAPRMFTAALICRRTNPPCRRIYMVMGVVILMLLLLHNLRAIVLFLVLLLVGRLHLVVLLLLSHLLRGHESGASPLSANRIRLGRRRRIILRWRLVVH